MRLLLILIAVAALPSCTQESQPPLPEGTVKQAGPKPFQGKITVGIGADAPTYPRSRPET